MQYLPVHWFEGLFLRPHHFQAADRYLGELLQTSLQMDHPYAYGLRSIDISDTALANNQFEVRSLKARMRDGTVIDIGTGQMLDRLDLKPEFESASVVRVFLAVPRAHLGAANVATAHQKRERGVPRQPEPDLGAANVAAAHQKGVVARYGEQAVKFQDETMGGNDQEVRFKELNIKLLFSTQELEGYEVLPIAQIERTGDQAAVPRLDGSYFPPVLAIDAWPSLSRDIVRAIGDIVGKKIEVLAQQVASRKIDFNGHDPGDLERMLMLGTLYGAATSLSVLANARGVHPFTAYHELARFVGQLAIFGKDRSLPKVPPYDHDDLAGIFEQLRKLIDAPINEVREYQFEQRYFIGAGLGMQVSLEARWFNSDWQWFVGVHKEGISNQDCQDLLASGHLDWKLGSSRQAEYLFSYGLDGLKLIPVRSRPTSLPDIADWIYFEVSRLNDAWKDVQATQTLAIRLRDSLIVNRDRLQGERKLVVARGEQQVTLEFALFALPT
jgi:type VI secretion system protein ImpJ